MSNDAPIQLSQDQVEWLLQLKMSKRAALVRDHILEHGSITTGELAALGYDHPPRAVRDLKDAGAGVEKVMVKDSNGRRMARYTFNGKANQDGAGRVVIPKAFSDSLKKAFDFRCSICSGKFAGRELQCDHRVPFAIAGDNLEMIQEDFMPLCASDNRAKSWSCEHCENWEIKDEGTCTTCFWSNPEDYSHVAMRQERRLVLTFQDTEVDAFDSFRNSAEGHDESVEDLAKQKLLGN